MGMDQRVTFPGGAVPAWEAVRGLLAERGLAVEMRMIDGELSFPDEAPPAAWRELRIGMPAGMVTVRREADAVVLTVWGNADAALAQAWHVLAQAFADAGGGTLHSAGGP